MIMAESTVLEDIKTGKQVKRCRYFKAKVVTNHKADQTDNTLQSASDNDQIILFTDQSTSCVNVTDYVELHISVKSNEQTTKETLKWEHIAIVMPSETS